MTDLRSNVGKWTMAVFRKLLQNFPSQRFWLPNLFFWMVMNSIASFMQYRAQTDAGEELHWFDAWLSFLPWWLPWVFITPFMYAFICTLEQLVQRPWLRYLWHTAIFMLIIPLYWLVAIMPVMLVQRGNLEAFAEVYLRVATTSFYIDVFIYLGVLSLCYSLRFYENAMREKNELRRMSHQLIQVELKSLRSQLNPHFLFNTLNTIASLVRLQKEKEAVKALSELSLMLRQVLESQNNQYVPMKKEIDFINSYLAIQKMRFGDKLSTQVTVDEECLEMDIPFMLLHPLVENAIQHGAQLDTEKNQLTFEVQMREGQMQMRLVNKVPEFDEHKGFGIGLKTCRERLARLYKEFQLTLTPIDNGYFETYLSIPAGGPDDQSIGRR